MHGARARPRPRIRTSPFTALLVVASVASILIVAGTIAARLAYPYPLQPLEGAVLEQARHGPLDYAPPRVADTAFIYGPGSTAAIGAVGALTGWRLGPVRALSALATAAAVVAVGATIRRETRDRLAALVGAAIFATCFGATAGWFDLVRVDPVATAALFGGLFLAHRGGGRRCDAAFAATALALAALARANLLVAALGIIVGTVGLDRQFARRLALWFAAVGTASVAVLQVVTHGWFSFYAWTVPAGHTWDWSQGWRSLRDDLLLAMPVALAFAAASFLRDPRGAPSPRWFHGWAIGGLAGASAIARLHVGGYYNVMLPAFGGLALLAGLGFHRLRASPRGARYMPAVAALAIVQLAIGFSTPGHYLPSGDDRAAHRAVLDAVRAVDGDVWVLGHPELARAAGKSPLAHYVAVWDVLRSGPSGARERLRAELQRAIEERRFAAIVVTEPEELIVLPAGFRAGYELTRPLPHLVAVIDDAKVCDVCGVWEPRA